MNTPGKPLPPVWVTGFSYFACLFLLVPLIMIGHLFGLEGGVEALGLSFAVETGSPILWIIVLELFLFSAGIVGAAILTREKWAYDFGICYSVAGLLIALLATVLGADGIREYAGAASIQCAGLAVFLIHLVRNREQWRTETANKARASGDTAVPIREDS